MWNYEQRGDRDGRGLSYLAGRGASGCNDPRLLELQAPCADDKVLAVDALHSPRIPVFESHQFDNLTILAGVNQITQGDITVLAREKSTHELLQGRIRRVANRDAIDILKSHWAPVRN